MPNVLFSKNELERYARHLIIPDFNIEGQRKLKAGRVLVIGTGGLGAPLLQYLAAAGVGRLGIVDFDIVEDSNLQRQVLFTTHDIGRPKVEVAAERLRAQNPHIEITTYNTRFTRDNALEIMQDYDVVADGTDNFATRYLVNDAAVLAGIPNVYASIFRFDGQVSVFNYRDASGELGPNYRDMFPEPPPPGLVPNCAEGGVIGVLPGIVGSLQANEVIKVLTGVGEPLVGRLFLFDALTFQSKTLKVYKDEHNPLTGDNPTQTTLLEDYESFCGYDPAAEEKPVKEITVQDLERMKASQVPFQLIDVREPYEYDIAAMGGQLMPLGSLEQHINEIESDKQVIVHCRSGVRSANAIRLLEKKYGFTNLYNLKGGILAYADEVDTSMAKY